MMIFLVVLSSLLLQVAAFAPIHSKPAAAAGMMQARQPASTQLNTLPKLIVFDLDNTLWTPELYQLRKLQRSNSTPKAGKDVQLMSGSQKLLEEHIPALQEQGVQFAVASRTKSVEWAHALLGQFDLLDIFTYVQIVPGNKRRHFQDIQKASGISYESMLFFDDARDGKFGNCEPVAEMGVLAVHCPKGLESVDIFTNALQHFKEWDKTPGTIIEADGTLSVGQGPIDESTRQFGSIKMINTDKRYGFIRYRDNKSRDIFFHF
jgi:magnesium-dependent phosphatase 1